MRTARIPSIIAAAVALSLLASPARPLAQNAPVVSSTPTTAPAASNAAVVPTAAPNASPLPADQEPPPPRTLRAYYHVFIAFALAWAFVFGYVLYLGRRFKRVEQEVEQLAAS